MDMVIKFAVLQTATPSIEDGGYERTIMLHCILEQARFEIRGGVQLTSENIDIGLKAWLHRKGIVDGSDIKAIETAAGSLTRGLLMLLRILPRRPHGGRPLADNSAAYKVKHRPRNEKPDYNSFDPFEYEQVKKYVQNARTQRNEKLEQQIQDAKVQRKDQTEGVLAPFPVAEAAVENANVSVTNLLTEINDQLPRGDDQLAFDQLLDSKPEWKASVMAYVCGADAPETNIRGQAVELLRSIVALDDDDMEDRIFVPDSESHDQVALEFRAARLVRSCKAGVSRKTDRRRGERQYRWTPGPQVKADWEQEYQLNGYLVRVPAKPHAGGPVCTLCYMQIFFPKSMDFGQSHLTLLPEFCEEGKKHHQVWATRSQDIDPACRMAIKARGFRKDGSRFEMYLERDTDQAVTTANAFADRVLLGLDVEAIRMKERRWVPKKRERSDRGRA
ncbi:hypothetical protein LEL_00891 [Akanthomyces lecanii RCEF 1005]|uniref:Uncharacterized protein n=1 Tax=Akanthomyces lecanii RCEF 1005 TaxID=1081108 RepID=A0A162KMR0_CORDF|nr:hypothetical protein LEL_00891 [Akanthomyces lecanii RCEF 1005]